MKPITGQYECVHRSGVGLDYFTSRIDRMTLQNNGRFVQITQDRSRIANAAQSLASGQQVSTTAPETRREGSYAIQGNIISFHFDDGTQEQGQISVNGDGILIGKKSFNKVSDSTIIPSTNRLKKDMEDIAKGLKIAGTIGGMAIKVAKTVHNTIQDAQSPQNAPPPSQPQSQGPLPRTQGNSGQAAPYQASQPQPIPSRPVQPAQNMAPHEEVETLYCDQCGNRVRPGKRFCNICGARLP